ncbi:MAG: aminotransferase class V-fold PLP-dependent enzyme [Dorea sp.]|nr:aminotransferase class V-fold PLP-dependent enzyme [Dorea sp.]
MAEGLYEKLESYSRSDAYPFHMPGHKRNVSFAGNLDYYGIDITEIRDFDDLHHPDGILLDAQKKTAGLFHAEESHFLVNGSTVGILSAILGCTDYGDKILLARNCHKSVYHAIYLHNLKPVYVYPDFDEETQLNGELRLSAIRKQLEAHPDVKALVMVSPTYDGVVSDVKAIAALAHSYQIPLIVDEAHGAHFGFHPYFPENSCQLGADLVIHSLHKTLPSPTQTALLHMNGDLVDRDRVRMHLHMLQSSSPSYLLMAGIDRCIQILGERSEEIFDSYVNRLAELRDRLQGLSQIQIVETEHFDRSKIVISVAGAKISSKELTALLWERYHLEFEMTAGSYTLAMTSVCDSEEGMNRLAEALLCLDQELSHEKKKLDFFRLPETKAVCTIRQAQKEKQRGLVIDWEASIGEVAAEYAYVYPPGIPVIVPGEIISREAIDVLQWYCRNRFQVEGVSAEGKIAVLSSLDEKDWV